MRRAVLILAMAAWGGGAGAFDNDYPALFAAHEAEVLAAQPGVRRLELPGPVIIEEILSDAGATRYVASDQSGRGAAGCSFELLLDLVVLSGMCEDMLSREEHAVLEAHLWRVGRFVGQNAYPPVAEAALRPGIVSRLQARLEAYGRDGGAICPESDGARLGLAEMARNLTRGAGRAAIDRLVGQPRLPVMRPCE